MPSSTSSSEGREATRAIAGLLIGLFSFCLTLEVATQAGFARVSRIRGRVEQDLQAARSLRPRGRGNAPTMLVVGNSLLLLGVDRESLTRGLAPKYDVALLPVENTQYEDWYFGLRRLFSDGARPTIVVVSLTTRQMMASSTNGEHFAHFLMRPSDLLEVKRESQLDNTTTSAYCFANRSEWLGARAQIRNWLFSKLIPGLAQVTALFPSKHPAMPPPAEVVAVVMPHLQALNRVCRENGSRLVVIVPPTLSEEAVASAEIQEAAARAGIKVLVPMRLGEVPPEEFTDGFHLNAAGAARFTPRLGKTLLKALSDDDAAPTPVTARAGG